MNPDVTVFLDKQNHPLRNEIELLRSKILEAREGLSENIKWNGPNYTFNGDDRITMRIHPPKQIQLVFHRGAKKLEQPHNKIIEDTSGLLVWKENDRAVVSFKTSGEIDAQSAELKQVIIKWITATS